MEDQRNSSLPGDPLGPAEMPHLTPESLSYLQKAAKWGKFLAILGFIVAGLMIIAGIMMSFVLNMVQDEMVPLNMPFSPKILSVFYILIAGIYMIPVIFLNSFSNNVLKAARLGSTEFLTTSLKNLKNLFVFVGISTLIVLALYTIVLIIVGTAAVFSF
jgi:hypothetical protein